MTNKQRFIYNLLFIIGCGLLLLFLIKAPQETTHKLPADDIHYQYHTMDKKEAEKSCVTCHDKGAESPLPEGHPPKYRCLFCHKQIKR